jgi:plasmid stabilization system protein ParE
MPIEWSARARADLSNLRDYIAKDSPVYARRVSERIIAAVGKLADFPEMGRRVPEAGNRDDLRELIHHDYRIIYLAKPGRIVIVTVVHGRRDLTGEPWERIGD